MPPPPPRDKLDRHVKERVDLRDRYCSGRGAPPTEYDLSVSASCRPKTGTKAYELEKRRRDAEQERKSRREAQKTKAVADALKDMLARELKASKDDNTKDRKSKTGRQRRLHVKSQPTVTGIPGREQTRREILILLKYFERKEKQSLVGNINDSAFGGLPLNLLQVIVSHMIHPRLRTKYPNPLDRYEKIMSNLESSRGIGEFIVTLVSKDTLLSFTLVHLQALPLPAGASPALREHPAYTNKK